MQQDEPSLAEAGFFDSLAEVFAGHFDADAHLGQAGAHAVADAVAESLLPRGAFRFSQAAACPRAGRHSWW